MDSFHNLKGVLGMKRIDKIKNEPIKELCYVKKGINENIKMVQSWMDDNP